MAEYKFFTSGCEVVGESILSLVNSIATGKDTRLQILKKHGIVPEPGKWYPQQPFLNAFKEIATSIGSHTIFMIGKAIPEKVQFPPIDSLKKALQVIDQAYKMNQRGGDSGEYKLSEFDEKNKTAVMVCRNPYPSEFDRGIITAIVRKFKPAGSFKSDVILDTTKETRSKGAESCTFKIFW